jgi:hypothetical protein
MTFTYEHHSWIYATDFKNRLQATHAQLSFGLAPTPALVSAAPAVTATPPKPDGNAKAVAAMSSQAEDKYAALKDLDNIFKTSVELNAKPAIEPEPFPSKPAAVPNRTYNPFTADFGSSPQQLNTSPWPLSASPSGPGKKLEVLLLCSVCPCGMTKTENLAICCSVMVKDAFKRGWPF